MNTRVEYLYRDGSNYKQWGAVVFRGECDGSLNRRLFAALDREEFFIAHQVRLPELFFDYRALSADGHCWHGMGGAPSPTAAAARVLDRRVERGLGEVERASSEGWAVFDQLAREFGS